MSDNKELSNGEYLILGAEFALHCLYKYQHNMQDFAKSADYANVCDLLCAGLRGPEDHPQVPLAEIVALVKEKLGKDK